VLVRTHALGHAVHDDADAFACHSLSSRSELRLPGTKRALGRARLVSCTCRCFVIVRNRQPELTRLWVAWEQQKIIACILSAAVF
jgi:hypothetical protein